MKKMILSTAVLGLLAFASCKNEAKQTTEDANETKTVAVENELLRPKLLLVCVVIVLCVKVL